MAQPSFPSLAHLVLHRCKESSDSLAFRFPQGEGWAELTWRDTEERLRNIATALLHFGLETEQRVGILSTTRVEWILADYGVLLAGGATTTVYPSNTAEECRYILTDSDTRLLFVEDMDQVQKVLSVKEHLPALKKVIVFDGRGDGDFVLSLQDLEALGQRERQAQPKAVDDVVAKLHKDMLATLIYTSGTTGVPKGVELTHDCWLFEAEAIANIGILSPSDHQYLWLPLSHSFGKVLQVAQLHVGFSTTVDGRIPKLVENLGVIRPTFMAAAPRIFEKVYNKVVTGAQGGGAVKWKIFSWSVGIGRKVSALRQQRRQPSGLLALQYRVADKLVFSKLKQRFGGRIRFFISGSAPLSREMAEFFHAADILILEGYGLTETSAASCVNRPETFVFGTVGQPLPGVEVKIAEEDGEILLRGRGVMRGYHNKPAESAETLTEDRWLRTGDIGEVTSTGHLRITDRKKDLIKTSGGKYVAPQHIEGKLKSLCPYLSQVLVHGNNRNFCTALVTVDEESIKGWATEQGLEALSYASLSQHEKVTAMVQEAVTRLNKDLASYETVKRFCVLEKDLTVEEGDLTPSLKVKRKAVEQKYKAKIEAFYEGQLAEV
ncbi:MAG: AMP-dependent synthetase/ligase [Myxococcota bacterium]